MEEKQKKSGEAESAEPKEKCRPRNTAGWLALFAAPHKKRYIASVIFATLGVACSMAPTSAWAG
ncbi:hypothetical protein K7I13_13355 [Brucepastera parasyntrophica]|uniref:hypothetical protein n=1 Tax=Brucepastera parasyntrophica TaxID=2880008 RepID=UPI00210B981E|nr:hypothetical protein [Brucepastera parasyntrophica]ULQ59448.1 hypothetical protein K7I13_13355 [Brucepastera parasyntrophica]